MKKDKQKVFDEVWTEARIAEFLDVVPPEGVNRDFHQIIKAYQSMRLNDFVTFIDMMREQNRDINAQQDGQTAADIIASHGQGEAYAASLKN